VSICLRCESEDANQKDEAVMQLLSNSLFALDILVQGGSYGAPMIDSNTILNPLDYQGYSVCIAYRESDVCLTVCIGD